MTAPDVDAIRARLAGAGTIGPWVIVTRTEVAALLDLVTQQAATIAKVAELARWYDSEPNWREWRIGASIRAVLAHDGTHTAQEDTRP